MRAIIYRSLNYISRSRLSLEMKLFLRVGEKYTPVTYCNRITLIIPSRISRYEDITKDIKVQLFTSPSLPLCLSLHPLSFSLVCGEAHVFSYTPTGEEYYHILIIQRS